MNQTVFVFLALTLCRVLEHVGHRAARAMVVLVAPAAGICSLNVVFEFAGLRVATGAVDLSTLGAEGSNAMALLLLDTQHYGLLIAQVFFGLWWCRRAISRTSPAGSPSRWPYSLSSWLVATWWTC